MFGVRVVTPRLSSSNKPKVNEFKYSNESRRWVGSVLRNSQSKLNQIKLNQLDYQDDEDMFDLINFSFPQLPQYRNTLTHAKSIRSKS